MTTVTDPAEDMRRRWKPSTQALANALTALAGNEHAELAIVPMYQPGKDYGIWTVGQAVHSVELDAEDVLLGVNAHEPAGQIPSVRTQQDRAYELARQALAEHGSGTTAYAVVRRDGTFAVFEEILSA